MWARFLWLYGSTKEPADSPRAPPVATGGALHRPSALDPRSRSPPRRPPPPPSRPLPPAPAPTWRQPVAPAPVAPAACVCTASCVRTHQRCRHLAVLAPGPECRAGGKIAAAAVAPGPCDPLRAGGWQCPSPGRGGLDLYFKDVRELQERVLPLLQASPTMGLNITNKARAASKAQCRPVRARAFQELELACGLDRANKMTCCCTSGRSRRPYRLLTSV